jgi:hypothetical protein
MLRYYTLVFTTKQGFLKQNHPNFEGGFVTQACAGVRNN